MRKVAGLAALLLIALLLAFSAQALDAARVALALWWNAVVPSLFPFYVLVGLLQDGGMLRLIYRMAGRLFPRSAAMQAWTPSFLLGALSGFPTGARVSQMFGRADLAVYCNLCSPIFLLGVVAGSLAGDIRLFFPISIAHYASALLCVPAALLRKRRPGTARHAGDIPREPAGGIIACIAEGALVMLRIGGCIVFFAVASALLEEVGLFACIGGLLARLGVPRAVTVAMLRGLLEMTTGCSAIAALRVPVRVAAALYAACVGFGGLCILAQSCMVADIPRPGRYLAGKAVQAILAGAIAYWIAPWFVPNGIPVMQLPGQDVLIRNTASALTLLTASLTGVFGTYVLCVCLHLLDERKTRGSLPGP